MAHEVVTLQLGTFANFVGAHYWNLQAREHSERRRRPAIAARRAPPPRRRLCVAAGGVTRTAAG